MFLIWTRVRSPPAPQKKATLGWSFFVTPAGATLHAGYSLNSSTGRILYVHPSSGSTFARHSSFERRRAFFIRHSLGEGGLPIHGLRWRNSTAFSSLFFRLNQLYFDLNTQYAIACIPSTFLNVMTILIT